jgi:hypothetical protein
VLLAAGALRAGWLYARHRDVYQRVGHDDGAAKAGR